jgi:hypothetical protein
VSRPALGPTQTPVQWVPGVLSPGIKRGRGVTLTTHPHLVPRSWMSRSYTPLPPSASMTCNGTSLLVFTFYLPILCHKYYQLGGHVNMSVWVALATLRVLTFLWYYLFSKWDGICRYIHNGTSFYSWISYRHLSIYNISIFIFHSSWRHVLVLLTGSSKFPFQILGVIHLREISRVNMTAFWDMAPS